jgi:hypothetical protein
MRRCPVAETPLETADPNLLDLARLAIERYDATVKRVVDGLRRRDGAP